MRLQPLVHWALGVRLVVVLLGSLLQPFEHGRRLQKGLHVQLLALRHLL